MKYWALDGGHICLCTKDADDRDVLILGAIPDNRDEGKITFIDNANKVIKRVGNDKLIPFPNKFYTKDDLEKMHWEVHRIGTTLVKGHEYHDC